jgi:undecaprenyl-diphosphatase
MRAHRGWLVGTAVAAVGVYALMWAGYVGGWGWLSDVDAWALAPAHRVGETHPGWVTAWDVFCTVLGPGAFRLVTIVVIIVALVRRRVRIALFLAVTVQLSGVVTEIAKLLVDRPRPATAMVSAYGSAFPSGHALGVMVSVLALLAVGLPVARTSWRTWLVVLGVILIVAIGVGRVALNVHHPSDVIAGWALGYAYVVGCLLVFPPSRGGRPVRQVPETPAVPGTGR